MEQTAVCVYCGKKLIGKPYHKGGYAYLPKGQHYLERVKINYYGGYVCSDSCDLKHSWDLEQSMPGGYMDNIRMSRHNLSPSAKECFERNWGIK
jgi:hypothetical protein